jgi:hypothetical protein
MEKCDHIAKVLTKGSTSPTYVSDTAKEICKLAEKPEKTKEEVGALKEAAELCDEVQKAQSWVIKVSEKKPKEDREEEGDPKIQAIIKKINEESDKEKRLKNRFELLRKAADAADIEAYS